MKGNGWKVGIVYERYGYIQVGPDEASTPEEAVEVAKKKLEGLSVAELEEMTSFLEGSEGIDEEGEAIPL